MLSSFLYNTKPELMDGDSVKWNFTKFIINGDGRVADRFEANINPLMLKERIEELLV